MLAKINMTKSFRIINFLFICSFPSILFIFFWLSPALANKPSIDLDFKINTKKLSVTISHSSSDPQKHFIESVVITINNSPAKIHRYTNQPSSSLFIYTYTLDAKTGDKISVEASCSYFGKKAKEFMVGQ